MNMKLRYIFFALATVLALSCEKNSDLCLPLAVNSRQIVLNATGGNTEMEIYSTSDWSVAFDSKIDWASLNRLKGTGNDFIILSYAPNYDVHRAVKLLINTSELADTVKFIQKGKDVVLNFGDPVTVEADTTKASLALNSNLYNHYDEVAVTVNYVKYLYNDEDDEDVPEPVGGWITDVQLLYGQAVCTITQNVGADRPRKATITLDYTDVYGTAFTTTATLIQEK